ncbi:MAG: response regulator transcription factor [Acidimicrobiales bacterium]
MRAEGDLIAPAAATPEGDGWWWKVWRAGAISVLVVSESVTWRSEIAALLEEEGYAVRLDDRGDAALEPSCPFDLAVVDLAITGRTAAAVFAMLRSRSSVPILAVSPDAYREPAVLAAYAAGVDQLITRSQRSRELTARIRAMLRRTPPKSRGIVGIDVDGVSSISLDLATSIATLSDVPVWLTPEESEILCALLQRPGCVVSRQQLLGQRRGKHADRALDSLVRRIRTKLEAAGGGRRIVAVRGVGFRFVPDRELEPGPPVAVTAPPSRGDQQQPLTVAPAP